MYSHVQLCAAMYSHVQPRAAVYSFAQPGSAGRIGFDSVWLGVLGSQRGALEQDSRFGFKQLGSVVKLESAKNL